MRLDDISVSPTVAFLVHVAGIGQVAHDAEGATFRNVERRRDVAQPHPGIVCDAEQHAPMVREEAPFHHYITLVAVF